MNQLSISFSELARARRSDPATSKLAGINAARFANSHKARILAALRQHGPRSAHELSLLIGLTVVQIDRRLPEMGSAVAVMKQGGIDVTRGGCRVWMAV